MSDYVYVAVLGDCRLLIYYVYEVEGFGCSIELHKDLNQKHDKKLLKYGKIKCLDFEEGG